MPISSTTPICATPILEPPLDDSRPTDDQRRPRPHPDRPGHVRLGPAHLRDGHPQRHAGFVLGRRAPRGRRSRRSVPWRPRARWSPTAPTCSTSGASRPDPDTRSVDATEEMRRVIPVITAVAAALPDTPISVDTTKPEVAEAALAAGAHLFNDVWGTGPDVGEMAAVAAGAGVPLIVMHNRAEARYERDVVTEVVADLGAALDRAIAAGVPEDDLIVDPGHRLREDRGPQHLGPAATSARSRRWAVRSCWARRASPRSGASSTCRSRSGSRRPWRRPRSASPPASTSSASTTSRPTSGSPGSATPSCAALAGSRRHADGSAR